MPSKQFSKFKIFLLKMKKIENYGLNYHRYIVQPLVLSTQEVSSEVPQHTNAKKRKSSFSAN